jgi:GntR family transcriptional regulator of arabinose operon
VAFLALPNAAATVDAREAGYREALHAAHQSIDRACIQRLDPADAAAIDAFMRAATPDAIVCANDRTAAKVMQTLLRLGHRIPDDVRIAGIDDADYAGLLPVPLTTLRQPAAQIGHAALAAMLDRVAHPDLPTRDILLHCELIVRDSA